MKILSIISAGYEQGGAETAVVAYREAFRRLGHDSRVLSSDLRPDLPHYADYEFRAIPSAAAWKMINTLFNVSAYRVTRKVLKEFSPDVVILHTMHQVSPAVLFLLRKYSSIQCVHGPEAFTRALLPWYIDISRFKNDDHDIKAMTLAGRAWYWLLRYPYGLLYRIALRNVDRFLVFSSYTKQIMQQEGFCQGKVTYIPEGVEAMIHQGKISKPVGLTITYAGRLERYKGVHDLIDAMAEVIKHEPNAKLTIAGDGSFAPRLKQQACRLGLKERITFTGHITHAQLGDIYANAVVTVMPSILPETFGKAGVESMSVGTPVIATEIGGVKDWLRNNVNGILVPPSQPDQLAKSILRILRNPAFRRTLSLNARETAVSFSMEIYTRKLLGVIAEVASKSHYDRAHFTAK